MLAVVGIAWPFVMTWIILWFTDKTVGLQVPPEDEEAGLNFAEHGEYGYEVVQASPVTASSSS